MTLTKLLALLTLLAMISLMAAACSTIAPPGYDGAYEQQRADEIEWQNDPWR